MSADDHLSPDQFFAGDVPPKSLRSTQKRSQDPAVLAQLSASMKNSGYQGRPIDVVRDNDKVFIMDGHTRRRAAVNEGLSHVPVAGIGEPPEGTRAITRDEYHKLLPHPF